MLREGKKLKGKLSTKLSGQRGIGRKKTSR